MKDLFPYGSWVWVVVSYTEDDCLSYPSNESFIIAQTREEALEILKRDLEMELSASCNYKRATTLVSTYNGDKLFYQVEPINCLNPEACDN